MLTTHEMVHNQGRRLYLSALRYAVRNRVSALHHEREGHRRLRDLRPRDELVEQRERSYLPLKEFWPSLAITSESGALAMVRSRVQSSIIARRWSAEEDALLARLFREGKDLDEIAARLKRTIASVQRRVSDLRAQSAFRDLRIEPGKPGR
jgi:hypothetical protein